MGGWRAGHWSWPDELGMGVGVGVGVGGGAAGSDSRGFFREAAEGLGRDLRNEILGFCKKI
jgi:hypothetical protein